MAAYTPSLRLTLPVTGTDDGTWGDTVNNGITSLTDAAIAGTATVIQGNVANYTLTSNSGATDEARNMFLNITGALTAARNVICPTASKLYFIKNSTTGGFAVTLKTAAGTGISVPAGSITALYCDGTNVVDAITYANIPVINATTVDTTNLDVTNIKAKDGTASITMADTTGIATFSKATVISTSDATNAALRITQTGAGNAFVVEDSTSPDATPFLIDAAGRVIAGYTALVAPDVNGPTIFPQMNVVGVTSTAQYAAFSYINAAANAPIVALSKSRGATIGTNTIVVSGDTIGIVKFTAADGTAFVPAASISAQVDGTPGLNDMPGRLVFNTTADGAATSTERMRIDSAGNVGIGTITPSSELHVARNDATSYDGAATDGQLAAGSTVFIQQTAGTNTGVAQIVFQPRSTFPYNRIVSSGGSAPFMTFVTNNAEAMRITSAQILSTTKDALINGLTVGRGGGALSSNTAVGASALVTNTTGQNNIAIGDSALSQSNSFNNVAVGWSALNILTSGVYNVATGSSAGVALTTGSYNVLNGGAAGAGLTLGNYNVLIGQSAGAAITSGSKNTVLGSYDGNTGGLDIRTASNYIVLSDGDGNPRQIIDSSGNLGLGVTPSASTSNYRTLQIGGSNRYSIFGQRTVGNAETFVGWNAYGGSNTSTAGTGFYYVNTGDAASMYAQEAGKHEWFNAPSGTAGNAITFTQAMTLDASGNLGIGTTSPAYKLDVAGTTRVAGAILSTGSGASIQARFDGSDSFGAGPTIGLTNTAANRIWFTQLSASNNYDWWYFNGSSASKTMTLDASGNLGLGVTPSAWSGFVGSQVGALGSMNLGGSVDDSFIGSNVYYNAGFKFARPTTGTYATMYRQSGGVHSWNTSTALGTAGNAITFTQAMTLDASGNLGVGTTSPGAKLDVGSGNLTFSGTAQRITGDFSNATIANRVMFQTSTTNSNTIVGVIPSGTGVNARIQAFSASDPANASTVSIEANASLLQSLISADKTGTGTYFPMTFYTGGSERVRIDASGNLLVGTTSGANKLTVASTGTIASFTASGLASSATVQIQAANGAGYNARLYFECPGVNSGGLTYERATSRLYAYSQTDLSGPYVVANGTSWTTNSDRRLKTDIQEIAYGLDAVMALEPKIYSYKNNIDKKCLGLIAQDVASVIPEVVDTPNDIDAMMGIEYQALVPVLVKAIQEQQALITALTDRITALEAK